MSPSRPAFFSVPLLLGLALLLVGGMGLLERAQLLRPLALADPWPAVVAALGLAQLIFGDHRVARAIGLGLALAGGALLAVRLNPEVLRQVELDQGWPIVALVLGVVVLWRGLGPAAGRVAAGEDPADRLRVFTFWSGADRKPSTRNFRGGALTSIMGGYEVDLRETDIPDGEEAVLDVLALMGGGSIRVPLGWSVCSDVVPVMGGVKVHTGPAAEHSPRRLRLKGLALMGGIEVRN